MKTTGKTILGLIIFSFFTTFASAQNPLTFGVKAGVNLSDFYGDVPDSRMKVGYNAGLTADYRVSNNVFVLSGLEVSSKGAKTKHKASDPSTLPAIGQNIESKTQYNPVYIQLTLHAGYKVYAMDDVSIVFHGGPYIAQGVGGKYTSETRIGDEYNKNKYNVFGKDGMLKRFDFGLGIGAGVEYGKFGVNFGYDLGLLDIAQDIKIMSPEGVSIDNLDKLKIKNNAAHVSLAYRF